MKQKLYFPLFLIILAFQAPLIGGNSHESPINLEDHPVLQEMVPLNRTQLESQLGRKLNFKERIGLSLLKTSIIHDHKNISANTPVDAGGTNGFAVAGFVLGIVSLIVGGVFFGTLAIIFSAIALGQIQRNGGKGKGLATAGLILGIIGAVAAVIILATA